jgi:hypothetical protein
MHYSTFKNKKPFHQKPTTPIVRGEPYANHFNNYMPQ